MRPLSIPINWKTLSAAGALVVFLSGGAPVLMKIGGWLTRADIAHAQTGNNVEGIRSNKEQIQILTDLQKRDAERQEQAAEAERRAQKAIHKLCVQGLVKDPVTCTLAKEGGSE